MISLLTSFSSFSQTDTRPIQKKVAVVLSEETARLVIKDLIHYDAVKIQLQQTEVLLDRYMIQNTNKDELITNLRSQNGNLQAQLSETEAMYNTANSLNKDLYRSLKIEKRKSKFLTGTTIAGAVLGVLYLVSAQ